MSTDSTKNPTDSTEPTPAATPGPYSEAVEAYLTIAQATEGGWLTAADAPLTVHARTLATSLDRQFASRGEIQSALASSYDKCMWRLDARRPKPTGPSPTLTDTGPHGEQSMFDPAFM